MSFTLQELSERRTLHIRGGPALLDDFQARLAETAEQGCLTIPKMRMPSPPTEETNLSWAVQGAAAHSNAEALVDDLLLLASQPTADGIAQV